MRTYKHIICILTAIVLLIACSEAELEKLPYGTVSINATWSGDHPVYEVKIDEDASMVGGSVKVFAAEATGPIKTKLHPRLSSTAKSIWIIFLSLSVACGISYYLLGMNVFDSINYAMTTLATGGFATHNDSIETFQSPAMEYVSTLFCFLSGLNFILLYRSIIKGEVKNLINNVEVKFYVGITLIFTFFIMVMLITHNGYDYEHAFRCGIYQVVSFCNVCTYLFTPRSF